MMASNGSSRGSLRPHNASRSPSFVIIGLLVVIAIIGFNYWNVSTRNYELRTTVLDMTDRLRLAGVKRLSIEKRNDALAEQVKQARDDLENANKQIDSKNNELVSTKDQLDAKAKELTRIQEQELAVCHSTLASAKANTSQLQDYIIKLKDETSRLQTQLNDVSARMSNGELCKTEVERRRLELLQKVQQVLGQNSISMLQQNGVDMTGLAPSMDNRPQQPAGGQQAFVDSGPFNQYPGVNNISDGLQGGVNGSLFNEQPQGFRYPDSQGDGLVPQVPGQGSVNVGFVPSGDGNFGQAGFVDLSNQQQAGVVSETGLANQQQAGLVGGTDLTNQQQAGLVGGVDLANQQQPGLIGGLDSTNQQQQPPAGVIVGDGMNQQNLPQQGGDVNLGVNSLQIPAETQQFLGINSKNVNGEGFGTGNNNELDSNLPQHPNAPLADLRNPSVSDISPTQLGDEDLSEDNGTNADVDYDYGKTDDYKDYKSYNLGGDGGQEGGNVVSRVAREAPGFEPDSGTALNQAAVGAGSEAGNAGSPSQLQQMMDKWIDTNAAGAQQPAGNVPSQAGAQADSQNAPLPDDRLKFQASEVQQQEKSINAAQKPENQPAAPAADKMNKPSEEGKNNPSDGEDDAAEDVEVNKHPEQNEANKVISRVNKSNDEIALS